MYIICLKSRRGNITIPTSVHIFAVASFLTGRPPSTKIMRFAIHPGFMEAETANVDFLEIRSRSVGLSSSFYYFK